MSVDVALDKADPENFDALLLPGGVMNPDFLRVQPKAVAFVKAFFDIGKPSGRTWPEQLLVRRNTTSLGIPTRLSIARS